MRKVTNTVEDDMRQTMYLAKVCIEGRENQELTPKIIKQFIVKNCSNLTPKYVDLSKDGMSDYQAILRFSTKTQAEFCTNQLMNAKLASQKGMLSVSPKAPSGAVSPNKQMS